MIHSNTRDKEQIKARMTSALRPLNSGQRTWPPHGNYTWVIPQTLSLPSLKPWVSPGHHPQPNLLPVTTHLGDLGLNPAGTSHKTDTVSWLFLGCSLSSCFLARWGEQEPESPVGGHSHLHCFPPGHSPPCPGTRLAYQQLWDLVDWAWLSS